ncbi:four-carbon acid sugar kinase family protein [Salinicoccus sesuvii]|uniref:Four-carbon acid sugar kinase family protein n=1 Tax=Salinicoccus sesuvii TaxID=868281 RepID=A0ABV7N6F9_9STAP
MDNRLLLTFYGDDFTGSTDAMEALHQYGLRTLLFMTPPDKALLDQFEGVQCIGVAGTSRAKDTEGMKAELTPVYEAFQKMNPYFVHYKVCSTFDSSPATGSIGYAADLARNYFGTGVYPLLVAAPALGRYTAFGNHFAKFHGQTYRLDQHPVMSRHPVTPMDEADLSIHLSKQTDQEVDKYSIADMNETKHFDIKEKNAITLFDAVEQKHMEAFGNMIWESRHDEATFLIGSSGVEYALGETWKDNADVNQNSLGLKADDINKMLVVSGSVSDVTKRQLEEAESNGFHTERVPYELLASEEIPTDYLNGIIELIGNEKKVVLYTARGADDPVVEETRTYFTENNVTGSHGNHIGQQLGKWTKYIMDHTDIRRLVVSGGDTSGFVTSQLGIYGMEVIESIAPGAPLCLAYSDQERYNNLEIALKSGQLGGEAFYGKVFEAGKDTTV